MCLSNDYLGTLSKISAYVLVTSKQYNIVIMQISFHQKAYTVGTRKAKSALVEWFKAALLRCKAALHPEQGSLELLDQSTFCFACPNCILITEEPK